MTDVTPTDKTDNNDTQLKRLERITTILSRIAASVDGTGSADGSEISVLADLVKKYNDGEPPVPISLSKILNAGIKGAVAEQQNEVSEVERIAREQALLAEIERLKTALSAHTSLSADSTKRLEGIIANLRKDLELSLSRILYAKAHVRTKTGEIDALQAKIMRYEVGRIPAPPADLKKQTAQLARLPDTMAFVTLHAFPNMRFTTTLPKKIGDAFCVDVLPLTDAGRRPEKPALRAVLAEGEVHLFCLIAKNLPETEQVSDANTTTIFESFSPVFRPDGETERLGFNVKTESWHLIPPGLRDIRSGQYLPAIFSGDINDTEGMIKSMVDAYYDDPIKYAAYKTALNSNVPKRPVGYADSSVVRDLWNMSVWERRVLLDHLLVPPDPVKAAHGIKSILSVFAACNTEKTPPNERLKASLGSAIQDALPGYLINAISTQSETPSAVGGIAPKDLQRLSDIELASVDVTTSINRQKQTFSPFVALRVGEKVVLYNKSCQIEKHPSGSFLPVNSGKFTPRPDLMFLGGKKDENECYAPYSKSNDPSIPASVVMVFEETSAAKSEYYDFAPIFEGHVDDKKAMAQAMTAALWNTPELKRELERRQKLPASRKPRIAA